MRLQRFLEDNISLGRGAVKIPANEIIEGYRKRYQAMIQKGLRFKYTFHYIMPGGRVIVHIKVPSETVKDFYYDVLLELNRAGAKRFQDCHIKIFSNCPSFVYTYAYVFYHLKDDELGTDNMIVDRYEQKIPRERLMIKNAETKLGKRVVTERPDVRNPYGLPLFDKSVYYAIFYLLEHIDFNRAMFNKYITSERELFSSIPNFDKLMIDRKLAEQKQKEGKRRRRKQYDDVLEVHEKNLRKANRSTPAAKSVKTISANRGIKKVKSGGINKVR